MSLLSFLKGESLGPFERIPHMLQGKGHYGEYLAEYAVGNNNLPGQSVTYMNILVPRRGKATNESEIDVLVLHERGIYVIESKNYIGWIFGIVAVLLVVRLVVGHIRKIKWEVDNA